MECAPQPLDEWTEPEVWAWTCIAAGKLADFNALDRKAKSDFADLDPTKAEGWDDRRRLSAAFLQTILTRKAFAEATPFGGVRILGALLDDAPLNLEHARLQHLFWLERSRILVAIAARNLRLDGEFSLEASYVAGEVTLFGAIIQESLHLSKKACFEGDVNLNGAKVTDTVYLEGATFKGDVDLGRASISSSLAMTGSNFEKKVSLNSAVVKGSAFLDEGAAFKGDVDLGYASAGSFSMGGSTFDGRVDLNSAVVTGSAFLNEGAVFKGDVDFGAASIGSNLEMTGSTFEGKVTLNRATVTGSAFLTDGASFKSDVDFGSASIGSNLEMTSSTFEGKVTLNRTTVTGSALLTDGASFKGDIDLVSASIGSALAMRGSTFDGKVNLNSATVKGPAFLDEGAVFKGNVDLGHASIGASLQMFGSTFEKVLDLHQTTVTGSAFLAGGATFVGDVHLSNTLIGSDLDLSDGNFLGRVDLTGARIEGEFRLGSSRHKPARWGDEGALVLRNARCGALQDRWKDNDDNSWPKRPRELDSPASLDLEGFTYLRLGGLYARHVSDLADLLARDTTESPQPYEFLARTLREAGEPEKATDILYRARERRRDSLKRTGSWLRWLGMSLLKWTIGYGLGGRYFWVLGWVLGLTLLGAVLAKASGAVPQKDGLQLIFLSLDELLPVITLDKAHELTSAPPAGGGSAPPTWLLAYFYVHKIASWVLGSFLVAGLAGLTQRN